MMTKPSSVSRGPAPASLLPLAALASCMLWDEELRKLITRVGHRRVP